MPTPLVPVSIASTYRVGGEPIPLPAHLAQATPDTAAALALLAADVRATGGTLRLSDLFRSYGLQAAAHADWASGRKRAYSPPPGGSLHEAGRACDIDLAAIAMPLARFWPIAATRGFMPIIVEPDPRCPEAWHFEHRGSHALVHDHYAAGRAHNFATAAGAMAASAILSIGVRVDCFGAQQQAAAAQSALIRLGHDIGAMDGVIGPRTLMALAALGIARADAEHRAGALDALIGARFPAEVGQAGGLVPMVVSSR